MKHEDFSALAETYAVDAGSARHRSLYLDYGKRAMDVAIAIVLMPIVLPVLILFWVLVRRDGGAGFYAHARVGKDGKPFKCWKLRSMCVDSQDRLTRHLRDNPAAAAEWARDFKLEDDPRITRLGKFLRKSSIDELPQIWNVLKGEMSFVGPRPVVQAELARYGVHQGAYLSMLPGVTGLWQVSGRNDVSYAERVQMDIRYFRMVNFTVDLRILFQTFGAVIRTTGK